MRVRLFLCVLVWLCVRSCVNVFVRLHAFDCLCDCVCVGLFGFVCLVVCGFVCLCVCLCLDVNACLFVCLRACSFV